MQCVIFQKKTPFQPPKTLKFKPLIAQAFEPSSSSSSAAASSSMLAANKTSRGTKAQTGAYSFASATATASGGDGGTISNTASGRSRGLEGAGRGEQGNARRKEGGDSEEGVLFSSLQVMSVARGSALYKWGGRRCLRSAAKQFLAVFLAVSTNVN